MCGTDKVNVCRISSFSLLGVVFSLNLNTRLKKKKALNRSIILNECHV